MTRTWKDDRNRGPWSFTRQRNKWAYLNNPRWLATPRDWLPGGPDDYDGRESLEPQIFTPNHQPKYPTSSSVRHHQCGHWHRPTPVAPPTTLPPTTAVPTTAPPAIYIPWFSCPQAVLFDAGDGHTIFVTTDNAIPLTTMYVLEWDGANWTILYTTTQPNDIAGDPDGVTYMWAEPPIDVFSLGSLYVIVMYRIYKSGITFPWGADVFVFSGHNLLNNTFIRGEDLGGSILSVSKASHELLIDSSGNIHCLIGINDGANGHVYDYISANNGATFSRVDVTGAISYAYTIPRFISEDSSGNLYVNCNNGKMYISANNGASWAEFATGLPQTLVKDFKVLNDVFFVIDKVNPNVKILRSTDGSAWTAVLTLAKFSVLNDAALGYDGTYYYALFTFRDTNSGLQPGYTEVYRSDNGTDWTLISTFDDDCELGRADTHTAHLAILNGKLAYTFYYAGTLLGGYADVHMLTEWESVDSGLNWTPVQTPFNDLTSGGAP